MNIRWLGTEECWEQYQALVALGSQRLSANPKLWHDDDDDDGGSPLSPKLVGNVLVGNVHGPLIPKSNWFTRYIGLVSYEDIQSFLQGSLSVDEAKYVVLNYDTGGGAAKGCKECANFIREFSENQKPVVSYVDIAASAGLYNAVAGSQVVMGEDSEIGSLGAIMIHTELSKMRSEAGITDTVFRTSPKKALLNPFEPLTDEAKEQANNSLQRIHDQFVSSVAGFRGLDVEQVQEKIATGEMFYAGQAKKLKLADHVLSFPDLLAKLATARKPRKKD